MTDIDASTLDFLAQLRAQTVSLRQGAEAARRERDEAAVRLADLEAKLADSSTALRALEVYTGEATGDSAATDSPTGPHGTQAQSIEEAIFQALREKEALTPLEIARAVEALGVSSSASSVRARLSKLVKLGTLQRDGNARYSVNKKGSGATKD
ncbi:hypothetical protein NGF19_27555 [Streptomyces sp. RY43-2]|uniref:Uncharacterized protein n=1 Tax=Streptomyces macrolidinus TaxID=2952607 RepID=A0ABT0ZLM6_9ACTN|nr:hypothetical protein [Streptomyces macrolidinus]MCN9244495.1 hypothetical protein [Streptomyces macrolidinus]